MKSVKKIFFAFFALVGLVLINGKANVKASEPVATPWFITFSNGTVVNIKEGDMGFTTLADSFTVSYFDATGATTGGYFDLWGDTRMIEAFLPYVHNKYLANGESMTLNYGGSLEFKYYQDVNESGIPTNPVSYQLVVHRSILTSNRISTNVVEGKDYYDYVYFDDADDLWNRLNTVVWEIENYTTGESRRAYTYFSIYEAGEYCVTAYDTKYDKTLTYDFVIDNTLPVITLNEVDWMDESPLTSANNITTKGVKVVCSDDEGIKSIVYRYKRFTANYVEERELENGFTFYRKGEYQIIVTDVAGNVSTKSFIINNFGITPDPVGATTVGTEVTQNGGERGGVTLSVGYTRCLYLDGDAPSQSRLAYTFTSSDTSIATVSAYGTVEAKSVGTVVITCTYKNDPTKVSKIILTVE